MFPNLTGGLSSILSIVPLPGKMTIIPLQETKPIPLPAGPPFVVMFNPETLNEDYGVSYTCEVPPGRGGGYMRFNVVQPQQFSFDFLMDGTGASGDKREVTAEIELFKLAVQLDGKFHRPPFLLLVYGTFIRTVVLVSMKVKYTMFRKNGTPLRATVSCTFKEHTETIFDLLNINFQSPDLTRKHILKEGDSLPLLCNAIYESPRFYIEAAKANGLTNFRRLKPGRELIFPPIEK